MIFMLGTVNKVKDRISETILNDKFKISQRIICSLIFLKFILLPISWGLNNYIQILRPLYVWEHSYIYLLYLGEGDDRMKQLEFFPLSVKLVLILKINININIMYLCACIVLKKLSHPFSHQISSGTYYLLSLPIL